MKTAVVSSQTLTAAGRWDPHYMIAVKGELDRNGLPETPENVKEAMKTIKERDTATKERARGLRAQAKGLEEEARGLDQEAELTFPIRPRF